MIVLVLMFCFLDRLCFTISAREAVDEPRPPAAEPHRETKEEMRQETIWMVAQEDRFKA